MMTGTFSIHNKPAVILFDSGASHSFIGAKFGAKVGLDFLHTKGSYMISTPGGKIASNQIIRLVPIKLGSLIINTDLILLPLEGIDIILGMNWMTQHGVLIDIPARAIELNSAKYGATTLYLPFRECINSCAFAMSASKLEEIPVVCEYTDVFPDDLPGMPPDREIEFIIELQPGTAPISKRPYRMPPKELKTNIHFPALMFSSINWLELGFSQRLIFAPAIIRSKFVHVIFLKPPSPHGMDSMSIWSCLLVSQMHLPTSCIS